MQRAAGVLLPIFSLPSPGGIGTLGQEARDFIDFLHSAGQRYWQLLPIGPTGYGDSPYQSFSTFAGNPYFIDLAALGAQGLLEPAELAAAYEGQDAARVDYGRLFGQRGEVLRRAFLRGWPAAKEAVEHFAAQHPWLEDYALFMAAKEHFGMRCWLEWPDEGLRLHRASALENWRRQLAEQVAFHKYVQYLFFTQWAALRRYAAAKGVRLLGDVPIYVAPDSANVWAEGRFFQLDEQGRPTEVAGVPPDYFSADGQLWGNPLYDWDAMRADGFGWWIRRIDGARELFDAIRIDHFRGLESYWAVPAGAATAREGRWRKGPGMALVGMLTQWFDGLEIIAEDLGLLTPAVHKLLAASGLPGMRVLQFAFDGNSANLHLPHNHTQNSVCYVGTHDNATARQWLEQAPPAVLRAARAYLGHKGRPALLQGLLRAGLGSVARLFVAPMQDWLGLGGEARMNTPGSAQGNWQWRLPAGALDAALAARMRRLCALYGRLAAPAQPAAAADAPK